MNTDNSIRMVSKLKERANNFVMLELKKHGITDIVPSHAAIIYNLFIHEELTYKEVAENIDRDKSTVTGLIAKLLKKGYVFSRKSENDSRYSYIRLTEEGKKLPPIFEEVSGLLYKTEYINVSNEKREIFLEVLNTILKNF